MYQIAELHTAKRIVAKILYDSAAIGISVSFLQLVFRQASKALHEKRAKLIGPNQVDDLFMVEHGVRERTACAKKHRQKDREYPDATANRSLNRNTQQRLSPSVIF